MPSRMTAAKFKERLTALCVGGRGWPRATRDQHVLLKSVALMLETGQTYTEREVNERLMVWAAQVGRSIRLDHVALRRYVVDTGYVNRDAAGRAYQVNAERTDELFAPEVETINPVMVIEEAWMRKEEQKRAYFSKTDQ